MEGKGNARPDLKAKPDRNKLLRKLGVQRGIKHETEFLNGNCCTSGTVLLKVCSADIT